MKSFQQKQLYILERFVQLNEIPTNSENTQPMKKIILLKNIYTEQKCIMKIQPKSLLETKERNVLHEASFYQKFQGHLGVPLMIWSGQDFDCLVLILEELGLSIYDRMKLYCQHKKMRVKDAIMIGIQLLNIIKNFHQKDHLVRNITPETFSFGRNEKIEKIYVNDLLYMKKFKIKNSLNHIQQKERGRLDFLTPFMSKNVLSGKEGSRSDDIISVMYVLIYLIKGKLPWQQDWEEDIQSKKQEVSETNTKQDVNLIFGFGHQPSESITSKVQRMQQIHQNITIEELCTDVPREIREILSLAHELDFTEQPEYYRYITSLKKALFRLKLKNDSLFEWMESTEVIQSNLKAEQHILRLKTQKQKIIEAIVYEPFENKVKLEDSYEEKFRKSVNNVVFSVQKQQPQQMSEHRQSIRKKPRVSLKKRNNCQLI